MDGLDGFVASNFATGSEWQFETTTGTTVVAISVQAVPNGVRYAKFRVKANKL